MVAAVLFPVGCFIYAWTALHSVHAWIGPMCGIFAFFVALFIMYLASFTYLADSYGIYASSALAGQSLCSKFVIRMEFVPLHAIFFNRKYHGYYFPIIHYQGLPFSLFLVMRNSHLPPYSDVWPSSVPMGIHYLRVSCDAIGRYTIHPILEGTSDSCPIKVRHYYSETGISISQPDDSIRSWA